MQRLSTSRVKALQTGQPGLPEHPGSSAASQSAGQAQQVSVVPVAHIATSQECKHAAHTSAAADVCHQRQAHTVRVMVDARASHSPSKPPLVRSPTYLHKMASFSLECKRFRLCCCRCAAASASRLGHSIWQL